MAWKLIRVGQDHSNVGNHQEWQIDSASDIANPPAEAANAAPDSKAWTGDYTHIYNKANDGSWKDIVGGS